MKILIKTQKGNFVNLDNVSIVFADYSNEHSNMDCVVVEKNTKDLDGMEGVVIFEGTQHQVQEWMENFEKAVRSAWEGVNIINIEV